MKGKSLIIFSSIFLLLAGIATTGLMTAVLLDGGSKVFTEDIEVMTLLCVLGAYIIGILQIVGAIIGFMNAGKAEKANLIKSVGMILIIATFVWFIPELLTEAQTTSWYTYGYSVLFPVMYFLGGKQMSNTKN